MRYAIVTMPTRTRWQRFWDRALRRQPGKVLFEGALPGFDALSATQTPVTVTLTDFKMEADR